MSDFFLFADEAGDFTFRRQSGASRYFILCTLTTVDAGLSHDLLQIRRGLILAGESDRPHAATKIGEIEAGRHAGGRITPTSVTRKRGTLHIV
jgi:hypothetical protein